MLLLAPFGRSAAIKSTHDFRRLPKQEPSISIQGWLTLVRLEYQKCNVPPQVDDRLQ